MEIDPRRADRRRRRTRRVLPRSLARDLARARRGLGRAARASGRHRAEAGDTGTAAGALDPEGDGRERDEEAGLAVDGRRDTAWRTERYSHFFKDGVGLVLDAGRRVRVERVVVDVPARGASAAIRLGEERDGPFRTVAPARPLNGRTRFTVAKRPGRYVVVWVVAIPDGEAAEISEVRLRARR